MAELTKVYFYYSLKRAQMEMKENLQKRVVLQKCPYLDTASNLTRTTSQRKIFNSAKLDFV